MRIFTRNDDATADSVHTVIYDVNGNATALYGDGMRSTLGWTFSVNQLANSPYWREAVLEPKPLPADEDVFPLVMDASGGVWRANPVGGGYARGPFGEPDLDALDAKYGPLTMIGAV